MPSAKKRVMRSADNTSTHSNTHRFVIIWHNCKTFDACFLCFWRLLRLKPSDSLYSLYPTPIPFTDSFMMFMMGENKPISVRPHTPATSCLVRLEAEATKTFLTVKSFDHESGKIGRRSQLLLVKNVKHVQHMLVAVICLLHWRGDTVGFGK